MMRDGPGNDRRAGLGVSGGAGGTKPPLLIVVGPTAAGKTAFSIELALALGTEVITADSMQVYRGMDIGTAKPDVAERRGVVHHGIDLVEPYELFNVADFRRYARAVIADMHSRGLLPILAGGTGFYVQAVIEEFLFPDGVADWELRRALEEEAERIGRPAIHARLAEVDPDSAARLHPNDLRRVVRALEVFETTGSTLSEHIRRREQAEPLYDVLIFGLNRPREDLYERINNRVHEQIAAGLIDEVRSVMKRTKDASAQKGTVGSSAIVTGDAEVPKSDAHAVAMKGLGYKEIIGYLEGRYSLDEAVELLQRDTRHFARRQLTWFRADKRIRWLDLSEYDSMKEAILPVLETVRERWPQFA